MTGPSARPGSNRAGVREICERSKPSLSSASDVIGCTSCEEPVSTASEVTASASMPLSRKLPIDSAPVRFDSPSPPAATNEIVVAEGRHRPVRECLIKLDLHRGIGDVVLAADHMGDCEIDVVDDRRQRVEILRPPAPGPDRRARRNRYGCRRGRCRASAPSRASARNANAAAGPPLRAVPDPAGSAFWRRDRRSAVARAIVAGAGASPALPAVSYRGRGGRSPSAARRPRRRVPRAPTVAPSRRAGHRAIRDRPRWLARIPHASARDRCRRSATRVRHRASARKRS